MKKDKIDQPQQTKAEEQAYNQANGTPAESRYGREPVEKPDKVKPLAQYLSEYIEPLDHSGSYITGWRGLIEQALDAYESTENVKIRIERI